MPADLSKYPHWQRLVATNSAYRKAWLEGRFPPGLPGTKSSGAHPGGRVAPRALARPEPTRPTKPPIPTGGPGTELKAILAKFRITATGSCGCNARAAEMDVRGPAWCRENIDKIVDWLGQEAAKRHLPFVRAATKLLIRLAIRNAERKQKQREQS